MVDTEHDDAWVQGAAYEHYIGRWSRPVADEFLKWIAIPPGHDWLDVGCGTGALSQRILERNAPAKIIGIDTSKGFVSYAKEHVIDKRAEFRLGDACALPVGDAEFDVVVSGLVLNFIPDRTKAVEEMRRAVHPGGVVAVYVWDYADGMQLIRLFWDAAITLNPKARDLDEAVRFPHCRPEALHALFTNGGLRDVMTAAIDVPTVFENFDDYWSPFLGGQGPAPSYCMSLQETERNALRERLKSSLSTEMDGKIRLTARAWAVQGVVSP